MGEGTPGRRASAISCGLHRLAEALGDRAHDRVDYAQPEDEPGLRVLVRDEGGSDLLGDDPTDAQKARQCRLMRASQTPSYSGLQIECTSCENHRMNACSKDLRIKALGALDRGMPRKEAASTFGVSLATLKRWLKRRREGEDIAPKPSPGRTPRILASQQQRRALGEQLEANHDATLARHCEAPLRALGGRDGRGGFGSDDEPSRAQARLDFQKKSVVATERDERARGSFRERLRGVDPERLRFVDESSTNVALTPRYGRAPRGERVRGKAPRNWGKNVTLISSISLEGMGPSMSIEGPSDTDSFGIYMREILAPTLKAGQIVLMDNLSVHKSKWVRELIEQRGCQLWLLPAYSPDFNHIEESL